VDGFEYFDVGVCCVSLLCCCLCGYVVACVLLFTKNLLEM
jgi:hypothetical protein